MKWIIEEAKNGYIVRNQNHSCGADVKIHTNVLSVIEDLSKRMCIINLYELIKMEAEKSGKVHELYDQFCGGEHKEE